MDIVNNNFNDKIELNRGRFCVFCGISIDEIRMRGVVGCANCYIVFADEIKDIIFNMQGTVNYVGNIPQKYLSKAKIDLKIMELERKKNEAISQQNFIVAESLKNEIEKLKGEL